MCGLPSSQSGLGDFICLPKKAAHLEHGCCVWMEDEVGTSRQSIPVQQRCASRMATSSGSDSSLAR